MGGAGPGGMHVFLCYARGDAPAVDRLQVALEAAGIQVWRDTAQLWPGEDWREKIRQAIAGNALAFVACFSRSGLARGKSYQYEELVLAVDELRLRRPACRGLSRSGWMTVRSRTCRSGVAGRSRTCSARTCSGNNGSRKQPGWWPPPRGFSSS